jgi:hypothetical protein
LAKLHNKDYGSDTGIGFANPTQEYMSAIIKRDIETIRAYSYMLQNQKLIKIEEQEKVFKGYNSDGESVYEPFPNNYIVRYRDSENKYYIGG